MAEQPERRIVKSAILRARWPEIEAALALGHCLRDIWPAWNQELGISYRQFTRVLSGYVSAPPPAIRTAPPKVGKSKLPVPPKGTFDPLRNLREHENRPKGFEYKGTRSSEELI